MSVATPPRPANATATRILVADPIADDGVERLRAAGEVDVATGLGAQQLAERIAEYDALVVRSETKVTAALLEAAARLRVVGRAGVGVDNIDIGACTERGILVLNAPTGNTIAAAEHAVAMLFALARNIPAADRSLHEGRWERSRFLGMELREKTLGVLGLGKIGFEVARVAREGLRMRVLAHDPLVTPDRAHQAGAELCDMDTLLAQSDILTMHVPLTDVTRGVIGARELARMKEGARLVNVARGGIIDEAALAAAIEKGHIAGAAIDVFVQEPPPADHPLLQLPQVVVTPHLGASTHEAQVNVAFDVADQIVEYLNGGTPRYAVNAPTMLPEELEQLRPYLEVAEKIGLLAAQLAGEKLRRVVCSYAGELAEHDTSILTSQVLRGLFAPFTETRVNQVNAKLVARSMGVDVDERHTTRPMNPESPLLVEVVGDERLRLAGTQFDSVPRITRINDFRVDMQPAGTFLVVTHEDRPGVIAAVSSLLAKNDINIARIELGRDRPRGRAVMIMQIDDPVDTPLLEELRTTARLEQLRQVRL
ncbi:MAG: phosphoglycerate dehydrogenase [Candidatus Dormibacteraeota bacterium]|nr:phosphoglycerate dehydrogenase [Candidatus Dormibacteraeota bacterium]MBV9524602.1 phosphoglycerate dehydrogenase [Candidatus Dormibacteraeota bacterium]